VDLLRWEQKNLPPMPDPPAHPDAGQLTLALAMRLALQDEALWLKPGMSAMEAAAVRQQVAALRLDVQRLWVNAVVARQSVAHSRDILAVAQAGSELGQRMAQVGNWSRARQIHEELSLWDARARLDKAQLQADRALLALWQRIGAGMTPQTLARQLPLHLPLGAPSDGPERHFDAGCFACGWSDCLAGASAASPFALAFGRPAGAPFDGRVGLEYARTAGCAKKHRGSGWAGKAGVGPAQHALGPYL
jgi:hypothetical protein